MKIYLILSDGAVYPTNKQFDCLKKYGEVVIIKHKGKLNELPNLIKDPSDKILAVDPDVFGWDMDSETINNIQNVKAVCTQSTSYDWVKPKLLKSLNIPVLNCAGFSTDAVAEYAIGMALDVARRLPVHLKNNYKVDYHGPKPMLLKNKKLGIIGLGRIGTRTAEIGKGMGMEVQYWSKNTQDKRFKYVKLDQLYSESDIIIPTLVENEETKHLITRELLNTIKNTSVLVGLNRIKDLWDEDYIISMVGENKLGGYAFEGDNAKELIAYKGNVWALPPMAWYTKDSLDNLMEVWIENISSAATGKLQNVVN